MNSEPAMPSKKILIVDDDDAIRNLHSLRLSDAFEPVMTGDPEEALALALEHKPAAILLDLMMPKLSGFELCQTLHNLSYTSLIPIFMITGESSEKYKQHCESLGAKAYFEKPVNYAALKAALTAEVGSGRAERRAHVRLNMRVVIKLRGKDQAGKEVEISTVTENVSPAGFLASCSLTLKQGDSFDVFVVASGERFAGRARAVRIESRGAPWQRYGFQFSETTNDWILRAT
jgi:DNA-binding response OmpR family regulator